MPEHDPTIGGPHDEPPSGSDRPTTPPPPLSTIPNSPPPRAAAAHLPSGAVVLRYRIERVIGEGGMGTVYLARQEKPDREVALKLVRPGYATPKMLRRFELEAEVLGRLLHPGIAQIYEAGTADLGAGTQPFFAMELVRGVPLTKYATENHLGTRARMELLAKVCDAVEHAHQKGVIHRDLKPGNILVTDDGQPKVLDFGVARATDADLQATTVQTDIGALVGTLPYMSPEQVTGDPAELDTRSDVYALGVIAFELLTGRLPYSLEQRMLHEAVRVIREEEPTRLSSVDRTLRGDVETIVGCSLEKDKTRRYQSASALAADIRRYLGDEPIAARPASAWYQLRKFSKRNRALVTGIAATFAALAAGLAGTAYGLTEARQQRDDAITARNAEKTAHDAEKQRADQLKLVAAFQDSMLAQVDPFQSGALLTQDITTKLDAALRAVTPPIADADRQAQLQAFTTQWRRINATDAARDLVDATILKPAVAAIDRQFKDQPAVDAALRQTLATRYRAMGLYAAAAPLQEAAMRTRRRVLGDDHSDTLVSIDGMGQLLWAQGRFPQAEAYLREALDRSRKTLGDDHPDTLSSINNFASILDEEGKLAEAESLYREAVEKRRRILGPDARGTLASMCNLGLVLVEQGRFTQAEGYLRDALAGRRRVLGDDHPETLNSMSNMAALLTSLGNPDEAVPLAREALERRRRVLGADHPDSLASIGVLGGALLRSGDAAGAEACFRDQLERSRRVFTDDNPRTFPPLSSLAQLLFSQGKLADAELLLRESLDRRHRVLGDDHPDTIGTMNDLGAALYMQRKSLPEAAALLQAATSGGERVFGREHSRTITSRIGLGRTLTDVGRFADAEPQLLEAHRALTASLSPDPFLAKTCAEALEDLYSAWHRAEPDNGHDAQAAHWKSLTAPPAPSAPTSPPPALTRGN